MRGPMPALVLMALGAILGFAAAGIGAAASGVGAAWNRSAMGRARSRAKRAVRPVDREARRYERELDAWKERVEPAARRFANEERGGRLEEIEVEALREAGASNVRWSALREAGYETLADVAGLTVQQLADVHGIGKKGAARIASAARELSNRVLGDATDLPDAELAGPGAEALAAATLDLLEARDAAGDAPRRLAERAREQRQRLDDVRRKTSLGSWVASTWREGSTAEAVRVADELARDAERVASSGLVEEAKEGRKRLAKHRPTQRSAAEVQARFRDRYAECCAVLEEVFGEVGLRPQRAVGGGQGGLPDEIARRVEAYPLRSGSLRATLRRYQEFGTKYVLEQERTILGDEMGLGKTMQSLAAMTHLWEDDADARFFVVAPAGLLINWEREIGKFTPLDAYVLHGDELEENLALWGKGGGVAITSYATLRNVDIGRGLAEQSAQVEMTVVDEAHYAKNPEAGRTQAVRRLLDVSRYVCLMSGTPMENHPREFLELVEAVRPDEAAALEADEDLELDAAAGSVRAFHQAVSKVYLRRNQEDVLTELPEKIEVEEWVALSRTDRGAYYAEVAEGNFMGMRRAATIGDSDPHSAKMDHLDELLEDHRQSGRKVLVFSYFLDVLAAVDKRFGVVGTISGKLSPQEKQDLCDEFQAREGHAILGLQIIAGGQGLNLQKASVVVLMEPQTKPSLEDQAIARAHRMGQTNPVLVHRLLARGTCDEVMLQVLAQKGELFEAYARRSLVKEASGQATEASLTRTVVETEQSRMREEGAAEGAPG